MNPETLDAVRIGFICHIWMLTISYVIRMHLHGR